MAHFTYEQYHYRMTRLRFASGFSAALVLPLLVMSVVISSAATMNLPQATRARPAPPITVVAQLPPKSDAELALEAKDRAERQTADANVERTNRWLIRIGVVQAIIFALQLVAFVFQAMRLNDTVRMAREQADDMRRSIEHAARGATAMEEVAQALARNTQNTTALLELQRTVFTRQMRAYLVPLLLAHFPQNREQDFRLELRVGVKNSGASPAHAIRAVFRTAVMPVPLPEGMALNLPDAAAPGIETYGLLPTQDSFYLRSWLPEFLSDADLAEIKKQQTRALYAYGVIHYKDIFDEQRTSYFCKAIGWDAAGNALWTSIPGRNEAT